MQSVVDRILNGNFNTDTRALDFSEPVIELTVKEGEIYEGSFTVYGPADYPTQGEVSSTSLRMNCPVKEFSGTNDVIPFSFDTVGLSSGDSFKGEFRIISNHGEYFIPFDIKIGNENINTSLGDVKNLFHFTNLAKSNWEEAVKLFTSREFEDMLGGVDRQYLGAYRVLREGKNPSQSLEEFLLHIKKKQPVEFMAEEPSVNVEGVTTSFTKSAVIVRNGWGYSDLMITTDDDFISIDNERLCDEDFVGNRARVDYSVDIKKLHEGKNYGRIHIHNAYNDLYLEITVSKNPVNRLVQEMNREIKHLTVDLMSYYAAFRCHKIYANTWMEKTNAIVDRMMEIDPDNIVFLLFHIHLLITGERYNEARWLLEQNENAAANCSDAAYCYYFYLTTLIDRSGEKTDEVAEMVEKIYLTRKDDWRIVWLHLYLSAKLSKSLADRWNVLEETFNLGSNSPVLYVEAYQILVNNPTFLSRLSPFEIQVMKYMAKNDLITVDIAEQFVYLTGKNKVYGYDLLKLLIECYEKAPGDEVLSKICMMLIRLDSKSQRAFKWYDKAVDKKLRITKLYEYYLSSLNLEADIKIPKTVLMYFAFDCSMDTLRTSYLYSYVHKNRTEYPDLYESYKSNIERFVMFQLLLGSNNIYLSYLYRNLLSESIITEDLAKGMVKAFYINIVRPVRKDIRSVNVLYNNLAEEEVYPVLDEEVYIPLYGSNYQLVLEDKDGNFFIRESEYTVEKLMGAEKYTDVLTRYVDGELMFDLSLCEHGRELYPVSYHNEENMKRIASSPDIEMSIRKEIKARLLQYYFDEDKITELDEMLNSILIEELPSSNVVSVIKLMVLRGFTDKAYEWICTCGGENIEPKIIVKLCSHLLRDGAYFEEPAEDEALIALIYRAFQSNKHEEQLIKYLVKFFRGTSKEMRDIWNVANEYGINTSDLEQRILEQMLYSNAYVPRIEPIFVQFYKRRINDRLSMAFLSQICFEYFVKEKITSDTYFDVLKECIEDNIDVPLSCKLAYTKYYSTKVDEVDELVSRTLVVFLKEILIQGMYFPYFKEYAQSITYMHRFLDKTMVEYRVEEGTTATIHYMIEKNAEEKGEYVTEELRDMYHGICVKQFVLFFGERLQYYITESNKEEDELTESGEYSRNDMDQSESTSKYSIINDIAIARTLGDLGTMDKLMEEYFRREYILDNVFSMDE